MGTSGSTTTILLVSADATTRERLGSILSADDVCVVFAGTAGEALAALEREPSEVVMSELSLPDESAATLLGRLGDRWPGVPVVLLASEGHSADAEMLLRQGATDFVRTPLDAEEVRFVVRKALTQVVRRADQPPPPASSERAGILGESPAMRQVYATIERASQGVATVLVRGESGTGKELVARAIHDASPRKEQPFVKIDCASLPEHLLESELFGYERGAFTGAVARKLGRAELADRGTLFLDEIGELSLPLQAKLLRLLQDRQIERLGGTKTIKVDVRVVAATHRDLEAMVEQREFRQDLFYRLNVVPLWLPPLRARREDVEALARHFCAASALANGKPGVVFEPGALKLLRSQKWPGNVRQLQNFVERMVVLTTGTRLTEDDVRNELSRQVHFKTEPSAIAQLSRTPLPREPESSSSGSDPSNVTILPLDEELRVAEKRALERALKVAKQNRSLAARLLGLSRSTLYIKLKEHGLL